jgi:two-component system, NarL family, sensor kinase
VSLSAPTERAAEYATATERVVSWLRAAAIILYALGDTIPHANPHHARYYVALGLYAIWGAGVLAWVYLRPVGATATAIYTTVDIVAITALTYFSGGATGFAQEGYFLLPITVAFRFRPRSTAIAAAVSTIAYVAESVNHPSIDANGAAQTIALHAAFIALVGVACIALSEVLRRRTRRVIDLLGTRERLLADALNAGDRERQALAESIHDNAIQDLLAARQELELARVGNGADNELARVSEQLLTGVRSLREAVQEIHPYVLSEVGLSAALRTLAENAAHRGNLTLELDIDGPPHPAQERLIYRLARELISNVVRHASAHTMRVELRQDDSMIVLIVADDGVGFEDQELSKRLADGHIGLPSQRVRIESAGGTLHIDSAPGAGTRVEARIPA